MEIAEGATLAELGLEQANIPAPKGFAIQARINMETLGEDGSVKPAGGTLSLFEPPSGPGLRTDSFGYTGYATKPRLRLIARQADRPCPARRLRRCGAGKGYRALCETRIEGVATNLDFLRNIFAPCGDSPLALSTPDSSTATWRSWLAQPNTPPWPNAKTAQANRTQRRPPARRWPAPKSMRSIRSPCWTTASPMRQAPPPPRWPLALVEEELPPGHGGRWPRPCRAPSSPLTSVPAMRSGGGRQVLVMEAMKMEHVVHAEVSGVVQRLGVNAGDTVFEGHPLIYLAEARDRGAPPKAAAAPWTWIGCAPTSPRSSSARPLATTRTVPKRWPSGAKPAIAPPGRTSPTCAMKALSSSTARWLWPGQRRRRSLDDLIKNTTGDGMVLRPRPSQRPHLFGPERARAMLMSYDYMVLAGTQGIKNHAKKDRLFEVAEQFRLPTVLFAEGGGGRPRRHRWLRGGGP